MTRGSWTIDETIVRHWRESELDVAFRSYWVAPIDYSSNPLNHQEARPEPPGPYCVYSINEPVTLHRDSGTTSSTDNEVLSYTCRFEIHAKNSTIASGKMIAKQLAKQVAAKFDPANSLCIDDDDDAYLQTIRGPDFCLREGDEEWMWILEYEFWVDAQYTRLSSE